MASINPKRGEIWDVEFDLARGQEIQKMRPAVVMNIEKAGRLALRIVVPFTTGRPEFKRFFWMVEIPSSQANGLDCDSFADTFQIKSVTTERFMRRRGNLGESQLKEIASDIHRQEPESAALSAYVDRIIQHQRHSDTPSVH